MMIKIAAYAAVVTAVLPLFSAEVVQDEAKEAVAGWAALQEALTGKERFAGATVAKVETYSGADGLGAFHVVSFEGGGFAVTSGDTEMAPILAYSEDGEFVANEKENPLYVMLTRDVAGRAKRLENLTQSRRGAEDDEDDLEYSAAASASQPSQPSSNASAWTRLREAAADATSASLPANGRLLKAAKLPSVGSVAEPVYGPLCFFLEIKFQHL